MEAKSIVIGSLLFMSGVAVGMHGARMAHEMYHMHHGHGRGPHMGPGHFHDHPFEDIDDLPYVRETRTDGEGLHNEL